MARVREREAEDLPRLTPRRIALFNARLKAREVAQRHPGRWVLGADTVVALGRHIFGKPRDLEEAEWMLAHLVGRTHRVITAVCLQKFPGKKREFDVTSRVTFRELEKAAIRRYLRLIHPLDKAGGYAIQEHGERIVAEISGSYSNVMGLPVGLSFFGGAWSEARLLALAADFEARTRVRRTPGVTRGRRTGAPRKPSPRAPSTPARS